MSARHPIATISECHAHDNRRIIQSVDAGVEVMKATICDLSIFGFNICIVGLYTERVGGSSPSPPTKKSIT